MMDLTHKHTESYSERHDCIYCRTCNEWLESACDDPECEYCKDRPEKPNEESSKES